MTTAPTLHAQALARIEEEVTHWRKDIELFSDLIPDSEADQLAKSELSAWQTLKAVLELQGAPDIGTVTGIEDAINHGRNLALQDIADLIIKGVLNV